MLSFSQSFKRLIKYAIGLFLKRRDFEGKLVRRLLLRRLIQTVCLCSCTWQPNAQLRAFMSWVANFLHRVTRLFARDCRPVAMYVTSSASWVPLLEFCPPRPRSAFVFRFHRVHKAVPVCLHLDVIAMVDPRLGRASPICVCTTVVTMVDP